VDDTSFEIQLTIEQSSVVDDERQKLQAREPLRRFVPFDSRTARF
jgi:hypothetical protein